MTDNARDRYLRRKLVWAYADLIGNIAWLVMLLAAVALFACGDLMVTVHLR